MGSEDLQELKETFSHFDRDGNGKIDFGEFVELMAALEAGMRSEEARVGFDAIDIDRSGVIEFDEFHAWWADQ